MRKREDSIVGSLLGTAVGDSIGLPMEGLSPTRIPRMFPGKTRQRLFFGRGMVSDDTDHACLAALALTRAPKNHEDFGSSFAWYLRFWGLAIPAGIGFATLRSIGKLWLGFGPNSSGVFSAGNGPAMRAPILGASLGHDFSRLVAMTRISTRITHTDPKAEVGALLVALATHYAAQSPGRCASIAELVSPLHSIFSPEITHEPVSLVERAAQSAASGQSTLAFAASLGLQKGISGYIYHTVPCVLHAWFRRPDDFSGAMEDLLACGGDTDTTAAILGGIMGAGLGKAGIPTDWLDRIQDWPWNPTSIEATGKRLAEAIDTGIPQSVALVLWPLVFIRNTAFLGIILAHGFRRLFPPYS
ncbi:MAG: ADP-ribosylglycohydrolase family protein [Candidatus Ozemobacteraceae bacterium]